MKTLKVISSILLLTFFVKSISAQSDCFPINPNIGQIEIKGKVTVDGKSKDEVFSKMVAWGASKSTNQTEQQIVKDKDAGIYKIYIPVNYTYKEGFRTITYAITMNANDGFFEYTINGFVMNKKPMEEFLRLKNGDRYYDAAFQDICKKMNYTLDGMKAIR
jgi:hypothetical protein